MCFVFSSFKFFVYNKLLASPVFVLFLFFNFLFITNCLQVLYLTGQTTDLPRGLHLPSSTFLFVCLFLFNLNLIRHVKLERKKQLLDLFIFA